MEHVNVYHLWPSMTHTDFFFFTELGYYMYQLSYAGAFIQMVTPESNIDFQNYFSDILTVIEVMDKELTFSLVKNFLLHGGLYGGSLYSWTHQHLVLTWWPYLKFRCCSLAGGRMSLGIDFESLKLLPQPVCSLLLHSYSSRCELLDSCSCLLPPLQSSGAVSLNK